MDREHILGTSTDLRAERRALVQKLFDPVSTLLLGEAGVRSGWRCLELGAAGGSITRWFADRSGPAGRVVAVDLEPNHLAAPPGVEVHRHDIGTGLPVDSAFDIIHASNVLGQLPRREHVFDSLVTALAPGGWLLLGDISGQPLRVLSAPSADDADLSDRVVRACRRATTETTGVSWDWAQRVERHMAAAQLVDIRGFEYAPMLVGSGAVAALADTYVRSVEPAIARHGISPDELERFHSLMHDPSFRAWPFFRLVLTVGRKAC